MASIFETLRLYPRERLLVPPLHWTDRHMQLLGCTFVDDDCSQPTSVGIDVNADTEHHPSTSSTSSPCSPAAFAASQEASPPPTPESSPDRSIATVTAPTTLSSISSTSSVGANANTSSTTANSQPCSPPMPRSPPASFNSPTPPKDPSPRQRETWARTMARSHVVPAKQGAITNLLQTGPSKVKQTSKMLTASVPSFAVALSFESHRYRLPCFVFSVLLEPTPAVAVLPTTDTRTTATKLFPTIAFLDGSDIETAREESLTYMYKPRVSPPTWRLYKKHLARLTPADPRRDAYVTALLTAMAQENQAASRDYASTSGATRECFRSTPPTFLRLSSTS
ncbi:hypothetical protein ColLi_09250 [Colletotrichum liriopes]|uniref:Uncharacterized protein n=1 Tax=Colletotrichum liriopes TaxID=708192 RepID=A0AA37LVW4_9PEZI|nr:hypothetical protein ColLi_09250 [Colletotrichum liriopes]